MRTFIVAGLITVCIALRAWGQATEAPRDVVLENDYLQYAIAADGRNLHFADKAGGKDYLAANGPCATVKNGGKSYAASKASYANGRLSIEFGESGVRAEIAVALEKHYLRMEVVSVSDDQVEELWFTDMPLSLKGNLDEPFACCALALNLKTNVPEIPGPNSRLRAACYRRFGLQGAKVALIGCPAGELRNVMKEVVAASPELPQSPIGGPWALDADINRGSYLFDLEGISEETVDSWIQLTKQLGMNQIDFNTSFRYGDCRPRPDRYPKGRDSVKAVVDKLHAAGIAAGLHTYAFFIAKDTPYVTPVPDARLGKDATFTLQDALTVDAKTVTVAEPTKSVSAETGFFIRNSVTLQIDDELVTYAGVSKEPPFGFTGCARGACGTKPAPHAAGAKVHHLKECFGLFAPDADSTLLTEVAANTADTFNACGFDMMYLDALDGEDILAGGENAWHYGSKFVFDIAARINKPALFEMSTFHHHLWYVRARMGAWDHPCRSHKRFVDLHCKANDEGRGMFLPMHLGWWAVQTWSDGASETYSEPTFSDDIEYLMCKSLGKDTGVSLMGVTPGNLPTVPAYQRLAPIFKQYEDLRHAKSVPESIKARLRKPQAEFTLEQTPEGKAQFRPVQYDKHKVQGIDGWSSRWISKNPFGPQPAQLRIEALMSALPQGAPDRVVLDAFDKPEEFKDRQSELGVTAALEKPSKETMLGVWPCAVFSAASERPSQTGTWARIARVFSPPRNIAKQKALGLWVLGDGQGELLNIQLRSPAGRAVGGIGDHYAVIDFTGWRYFELVELEGGRIADYGWPYAGDAYGVYREPLDYGQIETLALWYNNLPPGKKVSCVLGPIEALPLVKAKFRNPAVTIGGKTLTFPVEFEAGGYIEFRSMSDCKLYGPKGEIAAEVHPTGEVPMLAAGDNPVEFACEVVSDLGLRTYGPHPGPEQPPPWQHVAGISPRAYVTAIARGEPLPESP